MALLKPRTATVVLYQGDDMERLTDLRRAADAAEIQAHADLQSATHMPKRLGDEAPIEAFREAVQPTRAALNAFIDEAAERAVEIQIQAIGSTRFMDLVLAHPPRQVQVDGKTVDHPDDAAFADYLLHYGIEDGAVNTATFPKALLKHREGRRTIVDPDLSEEDLAEFLDEECSAGHIDEMWRVAYLLNRAVTVDPKGARFLNNDPTLPPS
jgi:hypothetical protein